MRSKGPFGERSAELGTLQYEGESVPFVELRGQREPRRLARWSSHLLLTFCLTAGWGCLTSSQRPPAQPLPQATPTAASRATPSPPPGLAECEKHRASLEAQLLQLEEENARLHLSLLERAAILDDYRERAREQDRELVSVVQEVVRAKAKLRSLDSRAEAASVLAEAEIAVSRAEGTANQNEDLLRARDLLEKANAEFSVENYSGSLYLANLARGVVREAELAGPMEADGEFSEDENPFAVPVELVATTRANVRVGPGLGHEIIVTVDEGAELLGLSSSRSWIRVRLIAGEEGWIYHKLVVGR